MCALCVFVNVSHTCLYENASILVDHQCVFNASFFVLVLVCLFM